MSQRIHTGWTWPRIGARVPSLPRPFVRRRRTQGDTLRHSERSELRVNSAKNLGWGENMAKVPGVLVGTAGVYYVASQLAAQGLHAAITHGNAPSVDILVGFSDGTSSLSLQVKTSKQALVERKKKPPYYNWAVGERSARLNHPDLFFALVNLRLSRFVNVESEKQALPEVFIVPSSVVYAAFAGRSDYGKKWPWWSPGVQRMEQYKNKWTLLHDHLAGKVSP